MEPGSSSSSSSNNQVTPAERLRLTWRALRGASEEQLDEVLDELLHGVCEYVDTVARPRPPCTGCEGRWVATMHQPNAQYCHICGTPLTGKQQCRQHPVEDAQGEESVTQPEAQQEADAQSTSAQLEEEPHDTEEGTQHGAASAQGDPQIS